MFFIISKILGFLSSPFIWIFLLLVLALFLPKRRRKLLIATLVLFYFFSNEFIFSEFMRAWEIKPRKPAEISSDYDVAIILGGHTTYDMAYDMPGFHESSDRFLMALRLYHRKNVRKMLFVGGSASLAEPNIKESNVIKDYLMTIGIPEKDILIDTVSRNTRENAVVSSEILREQYPDGKFLLITSGYHMRRALGCFAKTGLEVEDYSVDRIAGPRKFYPDHLFIPNVAVIGRWSNLLHEWIGYLTYRMMGYI